MLQPTLEHFRQIVLQTSALQEQLWETSSLDAFLELVQQLGVGQGCHFSLEEVKNELNVSRRAWRERGELTTTQADLRRWFPIRIGHQNLQTTVEWCYLGSRRFTEPFFEQTISTCLRHPFNRLFRHQTPISALTELEQAQPGLPPTGFIFHMSRCGSTLVAQMLASMPQAIVVAEAEPIDAVLRAHFRDPNVSDDQRQAWLRSVVSALGRTRNPQEQYLFIKFDSWNIVDLPLIRRSFPGVPWLFLYRDPVEVMVSHQIMRGSQMVPGMLEPELLGMQASEIPSMTLDEYCARTLGAICWAAARMNFTDGRFMNYRELPEAVWTSLLDFFGVTDTVSHLERMRHVAQFHAKSPSTLFSNDTSAKQHAATEHMRSLADQWVRPAYERLIELQQADEGR